MARAVSHPPLAHFHVLALAARELAPKHRDAVYLEGEALTEMQDAIDGAGASEWMVLSTCDRLDILVQADSPDQTSRALEKVLLERLSLPQAAASAMQWKSGPDALRHLFAVAASLDSETVGDPNVLGQLKAAHRLARASGNLGPRLETVLQSAYAAAKRVRSGTAVGELPVSLASVARQVAQDIFGRLDGAALLLVGTGEMGADLARHFVAGGIARISATDPAMAERFDAHLVSPERLAEGLIGNDIVICATESRAFAITERAMRASIKRRPRRPIFVIDSALPADVEPEIDRLESVFRYDLGDLERLALENREQRGVSVPEARSILEAEVQAFLNDGDARKAAPAIGALRARFEAERQAVLQTVKGDGAKEATHLLMNRLLHGPVNELRRRARDGGLDEVEELLDDLFGTSEAGSEMPAPSRRRKDKR